MWCPDGYLTLAEIHSQFMWDLDLISPAIDGPSEFEGSIRSQFDHIEHKAFGTWLMDGLISMQGNDVRACLSSGAVVRLHSSLFCRSSLSLNDLGGMLHIENYPFCNFPDSYASRELIAQAMLAYVNLREGCILLDFREPCPEITPIAGAALCIEESRLPVRLEDLAQWIMHRLGEGPPESNSKHQHELRTLPEQIVIAFKTGKVKAKTDAKRLYGRDLKHEQWLAIWREVVALEPSLSRPGPRTIFRTGANRKSNSE